jgi:hypothetical protein
MVVPEDAAPGAAERPSAPLDERVLVAGTTLRFVLLLALLAAAGASMIPGTVRHLLASSEKADLLAACSLAAGCCRCGGRGAPGSYHWTWWTYTADSGRCWTSW